MKKNNMIQKSNDVKIEKKYLIRKRDAIIFKLYESGYSFQDIATIFKLNRSTVKRMVDKK